MDCYAIRGTGTGLVKIGISKNPEARLVQLQAASPVILEIIHRQPGGEVLESTVHALLSDRRRHGEWFEVSDEEVSDVFERARPRPSAGRIVHRTWSRGDVGRPQKTIEELQADGTLRLDRHAERILEQAPDTPEWQPLKKTARQYLSKKV